MFCIVNNVFVSRLLNPSLKRLGQLYSEAGRLTEAVSAYVAAAEVLPKDPEIRRAFIELQAMGHAAGNKR